METQIQQQAKELIDKSKKILLVTKARPSDDSVGSIIALGLLFEKKGKEIDLVCHGPLTSSLSFLKRHIDIKKEISKKNNFIISLDTSKAKVSQFCYDFDDDGNKLNIFITPEDGMYDSEHVSTSAALPRYDLIVTVDAKNLESLGPIYEENTKLFFETPILNIDSSVENEKFGEVNYIEAKATSTTEVIFGLVEFFGEENLDENISTAILAGIISKTRSFQSEKTTPRTFSTAAKLISRGADQQKIVQHMFKRKSLNLLKLWGRALSRLSYDSLDKIVSTRILKEDFEKTQTSEDNIIGLEEELLATVKEAEITLILFEGEDGYHGFIKPKKAVDLERLASLVSGFALGDQVTFKKNAADIMTLYFETLQQIKDFQKEYR